MDNRVIDQYTLELEALSEHENSATPVRCIATNMDDNSTAETWLNLVQTNALLHFLYGNEGDIMDNYLLQLADYRYVELIMQPGGRVSDRCVVNSKELLRFGFDRDELRPWKDEK